MSTLMIGLAFAPATLHAQQPGSGPHARRPHAEFAANAATRVLALPTVLELTSSQVGRLEQIRDRANAQNQPLLEQLQALRPAREGRGPGALRGQQPQQRREQMQARREQMQAQREQMQAQREQTQAQMQARREQMQAQREQLQPVLTQLRQNAENTRREVESVLTSQQVAKLRELEAMRHPGGKRGPRPGR